MKKIISLILSLTIIALLTMYIVNTEFLHDILIEDVDIGEIEDNVYNSESTTYWYNTLNEESQEIYRIIANGIINLKKEITLDVEDEFDFNAVKEDIGVALNAFFADHPEVFYVKDSYEISMIDLLITKKLAIHLEYISDDNVQIEKMKKDLEIEIENINNQIKESASNYEKELLIHDIISEMVVYYSHEAYTDVPSLKHTAYSALVQKSAVCDGITKAFQLVLARNGIDSIFITGMLDETPHAWCKVKLDDEYYNVDVTSDKTLNKENKKLVVHSYFNITDEEILETHSFDDYNKLPVATQTKYNYYKYNDYTISYNENFEFKLNQIIESQKEKPLIEFAATGISRVPTKMVNALYDLNFNNYRTNNISKVEYTKINANYIVVK